ncbi:MAG: hypothetical protein ABH885_02370 [Candidatus Omnitrophota bacterium]
MENLTPMLKQYHTIKSRHQNCILFFRLGDFYEMFYDDARTASQILDVVLTARGSDKSGKVPMCGIPFHAADSYISRLVKAGHKVAICEQVEDPAAAKGIVKRDVTRVITSGTYIDDTSADSRYMLALHPAQDGTGIAFIENGSGTIWASQLEGTAKAADIITKLPVYECVYPPFAEESVKNVLMRAAGPGSRICRTPFEDWAFNPEIAEKALKDHFRTHNLSGFGFSDKPLAVSAAGRFLSTCGR